MLKASRPVVVGHLLAGLCLAVGLAQASVDTAARLVSAGRQQIGVTVRYDPAYVRLEYPGGDVPMETGVCSDVIIRAYRRIGVDLQALVHQDMKLAWSVYPKKWGLAKPDPNIDHRRVPNLAVFFSRHGASLSIKPVNTRFAPGDLVTWRLPSGAPHIGIVSDRRAWDGTPLVIHNIGAGALEENVLFAHEITGRYRYAGSSQRRTANR